MKKVQKAGAMLGLAIALMTAGCSKKNPVMNDCDGSAKRVTDAANAYASNQSKANCEAYKTAILDLVRSCPTYYTGVTKKDLDDFANTPCP